MRELTLQTQCEAKRFFAREWLAGLAASWSVLSVRSYDRATHRASSEGARPPSLC